MKNKNNHTFTYIYYIPCCLVGYHMVTMPISIKLTSPTPSMLSLTSPTKMAQNVPIIETCGGTWLRSWVPLFRGNPGFFKDTPWKINMEPTNHSFRKENDLPNLHDYVPSSEVYTPTGWTADGSPENAMGFPFPAVAESPRFQGWTSQVNQPLNFKGLISPNRLEIAHSLPFVSKTAWIWKSLMLEKRGTYPPET